MGLVSVQKSGKRFCELGFSARSSGCNGKSVRRYPQDPSHFQLRMSHRGARSFGHSAWILVVLGAGGASRMEGFFFFCNAPVDLTRTHSMFSPTVSYPTELITIDRGQIHAA